MGQKMKAIYFTNSFEISVNEIEIEAHNTYLFTTLEQFVKIKDTQRQLIQMATDFHALQQAVVEANRAGKLNKGLQAKLGKWL
jgi:hypothetical protein